MSKNQNNFEKPFSNQQELRAKIADMFVKHGHKVKYQFKLTFKS